jgi:adhesin/invasin
MNRLAWRVASTLVLAVVAVSCSESTTSLKRAPVRIAFAPRFSAKAQAIYQSLGAFAVTLDNVHVVVRGESGGEQAGPILKDTTVAFPPTASEITIAIDLVIAGDEQQVVATVELREQSITYFSGTQDLLARQGETTTSPEPVEMQYVGPGAAAAFIAISPQPATLAPGALFQFTARVLDASEHTVTGLPLTWSTSDATIATVSQTGLVTTTGKAGLTTLVATGVNGVSGQATVSVQPVASLVLVSGDKQTGVAGVALPAVWQVRALDANGNSVIGATITFGGVGGGAASPASATTDVNGVASTTLTLGPTIGTYAFTATVAGTPAVTTRVAATATAAAAAALGILGGNNQADTVLATLSQSLSVKVTDAFGNPVAQQPVEFVVQSGQASLLGAPGTAPQPLVRTTTDNSGVTQVGLVAGIIAGAVTVRASVPQTAIPSVTFAATVKAGLPKLLVVVQQPSAAAQATIALGTQPKVQVADQFSNLVALAGLPIIAIANGGPARAAGSIVAQGSSVSLSPHRLTPTAAQASRLSVPNTISKTSSVSDTFPQGLGGKTQVTTDANGVATFTDLSLDLPVGSWFLQFFDAKESLVGAGTTTIVLSPGPIESIVAWGVADTTAIFAVVDTLFPSVRVIDKVGNGIPGVPVTWSVADRLSILEITDTKTDADGVAAPGRWITTPNGNAFQIVATPTPSTIENAPLSLFALLELIGRFVPPTIPARPR